MGIFAAYSVQGFDKTASPALTTVLFVVFMGFVTVVALNALIAILGDSFEKAQEMKIASHTRQRAELMVEYYALMQPDQRTKLEEKTQWVHKLVPEALLGRARGGDSWNGRLYAIRDSIQTEIAQKTDALNEELRKRTDELSEKAGVMQAEVTDMKAELRQKLDFIITQLVKGNSDTNMSSAGAAEAETKGK